MWFGVDQNILKYSWYAQGQGQKKHLKNPNVYVVKAIKIKQLGLYRLNYAQ